MPPEVKAPQQQLQQHYDDNVRDMVDQRSAPVREQVAAAMKAVPANAIDVDKWFADNLRKPPLSHDTQLYNQLHQMKESFKAILSAKSA